MNESENIGIFNPSKEIARELTLSVLVRHRDAMIQTRQGVINLGDPTLLSDKEKKVNKVRGMYKVISEQMEMINLSRPVVSHRCYVLWKRKNMSDEEREKNPYEKEKNDYNDLIKYSDMLKLAEMDIINAEQSESTDDDYLVEINSGSGRKLQLTKKYFDMVSGLEDLYEKIYLIMLKHKIVSAGIEEDEIKTYKELEQEAIQKVIDA